MKLMCRSLFVLLAACFCFPPVISGEEWNPTPLVIDCPELFPYAFDGAPADIPFSLSGKPGKLYLIVNSRLEDGRKPVAVLKGWHFVNGIVTTLYVSAGREYLPGNDLKFPWDGRGSEREYDSFNDSGPVPPGTYSYYLLGYDNRSNREIGNDIITIGRYSNPQKQLFYAYDDRTGAVLSHPLLMGSQHNPRSSIPGHFNFNPGIHFKFEMGDDPYDQSNIVTTLCPGFSKGDFAPDKAVRVGTNVFDLHDFNTFYLTRGKFWENAATVTRWTFVPDGVAVQDTSWGDWGRISEWYTGMTGSEVHGGVIQNDGEGMLYWNVWGKNPNPSPTDKLLAFPEDNPGDIRFNLFLTEFYGPDAPVDADGITRTLAEAGRLDKGSVPGQFYMAGDASCCVELLNAHRMLRGAGQPFPADGSGYVVWVNSNGDWFMDKNTYAEAADPQQLWSCISYEPRNFNNLRSSPSPADRNGFMVAWLEFAGIYSCGGVTQDGTGIDYWTFADDTFSSGGTNTQKKGNGWTLDVGGQFDGLYLPKPVMSVPGYGNVVYDGTTWFGWDSDGGIITAVPDHVTPGVPVPFSLAQNSPNPFNPYTTISFTLAADGPVMLDIYDIAGQKIDTVIDRDMTAGAHSTVWNGAGHPSGVYFYTLRAADFEQTMKMTLVK
jgi:hypothetical protein